MNSATSTAYAELGLKPDATEADVKAAWRRLVSQWHPDRNASASAVARMQRINQALEAIRQAGFSAASTPGQPARRPASRPAPHRRATAPPPPPPPPASDKTEDAATPQADATASRAIHRKVKLTLEQAALGCTVVLRGRFNPVCGGCAGLGHAVLGGACAPCGGSGAVRQAGWYGLFGNSAECNACHGSGRAQRACAQCAGEGRLGARSYRISVRIPHGARDGDRLHVPARRLAGQPSPGDIDLRVQLLPHDTFELDDDGTLRCTIKVNGFDWVAQHEVAVPTLEGPRPVRLQRELRCHRLKGQGFPVQRRGERGDLLVTVVPVFPDRFNAEQQALLNRLVATSAAECATASAR